ncbi:sirohydrochlorin chelatase [Antrihabitans sp. YC2-6]|uniref:sirohydrochlorin chelatase n=1 Tax=Antrihabitans sp. YC2-6 TaxID=2799498 RepID=UPI0018F60241|nr:sirohydrochlorin chelatase [Antrihabitans sp. YC2-6]MBJ8346850.1 sirohydrochlorin chelatase [Antrihabitans sp. YC2-6]
MTALSRSVSPPLIAVAHGSRDPRSAATMQSVVARIREARPDLDIRLCFLDLNAPSVEQVIAGVAADGYRSAVVVPLLLGSAFHARVDLPGILDAARDRHPRLEIAQAEVLGTDDRLAAAVRSRILDTGVSASDPSVGVAVAAVGSSSATANIRTAAVTAAVVRGTSWHADICFATTEPSVTLAISRLRTRRASRIVVAPWFLAPGLLTDRVEASAQHVRHAATIGDHAFLTDVVLDRYLSTCTITIAA